MASFQGEWRAFADPSKKPHLLHIGDSDNQPIFYEAMEDVFWMRTRTGWEKWNPNKNLGKRLTTRTTKSRSS